MRPHSNRTVRTIGPAFWLVALLTSGLAPASAQSAREDLGAYLARVRERLGQDRERVTLQTSGVTRKNGLQASYRWLFGKQGHLRCDMRGTFPESVGFDGEQAWRVEGRSPPFPLVLQARERLLTIAWVWSGAWALEDSPFEIQLAENQQTGTTALELKLEGGLMRATLRLDDATLLPRSLELDRDFGGSALTFEDWRDTSSAPLPWKVTLTEPPAATTVYQTQFAGEWKEKSPPYGPPQPRSKDWTFLPETPASIEVRRSSSGHLFVRPQIDGKQVGWFLFDSGLGGSIITKRAADSLELGSFGETYLAGFGTEAPRKVPFRQTHALSLGPLLLDGLVMLEEESLPMADRMLEGETCAGALGWDVFLRAVVEIDLGRESVQLFDPATYEAPRAHWEPLLLHWQVPFVSARFEGEQQGYFGIDTGAGNLTALFHHSAAERLGLLTGSDAQDSSRRGASGTFATRPRELEWFEIAGERHAPAAVVLSTQEDGESDPYTLGFVGSGFLPDCSWVFDYSRERVGFIRKQ